MASDLSDDVLTELERLCAAAHRGPFEVAFQYPTEGSSAREVVVRQVRDRNSISRFDVEDDFTIEDAVDENAIAAVMNAAPSLLAEVRRLRVADYVPPESHAAYVLTDPLLHAAARGSMPVLDLVRHMAQRHQDTMAMATRVLETDTRGYMVVADEAREAQLRDALAKVLAAMPGCDNGYMRGEPCDRPATIAYVFDNSIQYACSEKHVDEYSNDANAVPWADAAEAGRLLVEEKR